MKSQFAQTRPKKRPTTFFKFCCVPNLKQIYLDEILYFKAIKLWPGATVLGTLNIRRNASILISKNQLTERFKGETGGLYA